MDYSSGYKEEEKSLKTVKAVGQMFKHQSALSELFKEDETALMIIQGATIVEVVYTFEDVSGSGFGLSWTEGISVGYWFGFWKDQGYGTSSINRQFCNLVETIEEVGRKGNLQGK